MPRGDRHNIRGYLELDALEEMVGDDRIETVLVVFPDMHGRLAGKRVTGQFFISEVADHGAQAGDSLVTSVQGDFRLVPDMHTLRVASWLPRTAIVLCDVCEETHEDRRISVTPREILRKQIRKAADMGVLGMGASELELYVFNDSFEDVARRGFAGIEPAGDDCPILRGTKEEDVIGAIRHHLDHSAVPVESSSGRRDPGQQQIVLRDTDLLEMADRHVICKQAAKEIAAQHGGAITFMARWDERLAPSSCHIHASLWDRGGKRALFEGEEELGPIHCSPAFRWFLGGWMAHIRELFAFYAPYPASYKRLVGDAFAPAGIAWSYGDRTAGFRIAGAGASLRIECLAAGADTNPYLAFAATLAAGLDGIANRIEPPPMFGGDADAAANLERVPHSLVESAAALERSAFARGAFGDDVVEHYLHFIRTEQSLFDSVVTDWERRRYFERA